MHLMQPQIGERERWGNLLAMAADLAFETDAAGRVIFLSPETVLGWSAKALLARPADMLLAAPDSIAGFNPFRAATPVRGRRTWLTRADGRHVCLRFTCAPVLDETGLPVGTRGIAMLETDGETRRRMGQPWDLEATTDPLTGLPNLPTFIAELSRRMQRLDRDGQPSTLMCADLDRLKDLNDRFGPAMGDKVLVKVAGLLSGILRPTDLIGRLAGDSFAMWLGGADHMTAAERAETLRHAVPEAVAAITGETEPSVGISIGIAAHSLNTGETVDMLIRRADHALATVKQAGRGHWRVADVKAN
jgi:diguanylate cyclase (GGDEF)-like protein